MKVVALISGGKDSCYNMMKCVAAGHEIVALANLQPEPDKEDELNSFMFQTVGHEGVPLIAQAMGIPLYRSYTKGKSLTRDLTYSPTGGDEVEDLYELLVRVCEECEGVEGVSSGAVLSNYQRLRVENVCSRLGLVSLSYLWRRDQAQLLREMIGNGVKAILIKVASMGLRPDKHLGRTVEDLYSGLCQLNDQYGVNVCGEGGEYETFTLDCPLFKKKIKVVESNVVVTSRDPYAPVGYLKLTRLELEAKQEDPFSMIMAPKECLVSNNTPLSCIREGRQSQCVSTGSYVWLAFDSDPSLHTTADQSQQLFKEVQSRLTECGRVWCEAVLVYLYLAEMSDYPSVNTVYREHFDKEPPARVCICTSLPEGTRVRMEVMVCRCEGVRRSSMHVQSHSEWAPANIGPYSQAYTVSNVVFGAGQIGLEPSLMKLAPPLQQAALSLTHAQSVLRSCDSHLTSALWGVCYYTTNQAGWSARQAWSKVTNHHGVSSHCPLLFLPVLDLPRRACVEWHFVALKEPSHINYSLTEIQSDVLGACSILEAVDDDKRNGCWTIQACIETCIDILDALSSILTHLASQISKHHLTLPDMSFIRICLPQFAAAEINVQDITRLCIECAGVNYEVPLSIVTTQGYLGHDGRLCVQACRIEHVY